MVGGMPQGPYRNPVVKGSTVSPAKPAARNGLSDLHQDVKFFIYSLLAIKF